MVSPMQVDNIRVGETLFVPAGGLSSQPRSMLIQDANKVFPIPWASLRVWDAYATPLPGSGDVESGVIQADYYWSPDSADDSFFVATRAYRVVGITARIEVAGTDGSAVTAAIKKAASGTDIASGTALHSSTINIKGTVNTNQVLSLSATSSDLDIAAGTCIGIDLTGTMADARGCVSVLLAPAASPDDLRLVGGTFGTAPPIVKAGDVKALGAVTKYMRFQVVVPECYDAGESFSIIMSAGMQTTIADASCAIDLEAYKLDKDTGISSDICTTSAMTMNATGFTDKTFVINPATLSPGDVLDCRVAIAANDAATVTAVTPCIAGIDLVCDIKG